MSISRPSTIPLVAESVLCELEQRVGNAEDKQISDEDLACLHSVFGVSLQRSLDILEKNNTLLSYVTTNKKRTLIEISGESGRCYRLFPRVNFCPCRAFKHQVLERKSQVYCKHVLAARLAQILGKIEVQTVSQDQYLLLVKSMFESE